MCLQIEEERLSNESTEKSRVREALTPSGPGPHKKPLAREARVTKASLMEPSAIHSGGVYVETICTGAEDKRRCLITLKGDGYGNF